MNPIGGCRELACEDRSERLDRKLGDGDIIADGLSRWTAPNENALEFCVEERNPKSGRFAELEGLRESRFEKGLVKANAGLRGLKGPSSSSSIGPAVNKGCTWICQSYILYLSSGTLRNISMLGNGSLVPERPPVLLDLRLRCLSERESGFISNSKVGSAGLCFRC